MGIPAYFSHIVKQHKDIIKKFNKDFGVVDNLLMDCNSIVYDCIRSIDSKILIILLIAFFLTLYKVVLVSIKVQQYMSN